jgi:nitric oxide dioxygenase
MRVTEREAELVRTSFRAIVADGPRAGRLFYDHLFFLAPATRDLFIDDPDRQSAKFLHTLGFIVAELHSWVAVSPLVEELAMRHLAYGVRPEDYSSVGEALQLMLRDCLGPDWTPELAAAWARIYDALQRQMVTAAYRRDPAAPNRPAAPRPN